MGAQRPRQQRPPRVQTFLVATGTELQALASNAAVHAALAMAVHVFL